MSGAAFTVSLDARDFVSHTLEGLARGLTPANIARPIGQGVAQLVKAHLTALDTARQNDLGGTPTHFYRKGAQATTWSPVAEGVVIRVDHQGIAQRYFGGTIKAKPGGALTIPADPEAYGKRAREFNNLRLVVFGESGRAALVTAIASNIRIGKRGVKAVSSTVQRVMYWLVKSVTQEPDPTVLPTDDAIDGATTLAVTSYAQGIIERERGKKS
jgi:hypothetical protein